MPRYEYRCRECESTFELSRPMAESGLPAPCPQGHADTVKLLSTVALTGAPAAVAAPPRPAVAAVERAAAVRPRRRRR